VVNRRSGKLLFQAFCVAIFIDYTVKLDYKLLLKIPQKTLGRSDLYIDYTLRSSKEKRKPLINIDFLSDFGPTADSLDLTLLDLTSL